MPAWVCALCGEEVKTAFPRNLGLLVDEHKRAMCIHKDTPKERLPLTVDDAKFLEELKVGW